MKPTGFLPGVGMALALSLAGSALFALFTRALGSGPALQLLITLLAAAYLLFLLRGSGARAGKVTTVIAWCAATALAWAVQPGLLVYLLIHMGLLWLVRCLHFYRSALAALLDMGLQAVSLGAALWALQQTGSLLLCLWSFFLVQALFVAIPPGGLRPRQDEQDIHGGAPGFRRARHSAESALRRLSLNH